MAPTDSSSTSFPSEITSPSPAVSTLPSDFKVGSYWTLEPLFSTDSAIKLEIKEVQGNWIICFLDGITQPVYLNPTILNGVRWLKES